MTKKSKGSIFREVDIPDHEVSTPYNNKYQRLYEALDNAKGRAVRFRAEDLCPGIDTKAAKLRIQQSVRAHYGVGYSVHITGIGDELTIWIAPKLTAGGRFS